MRSFRSIHPAVLIVLTAALLASCSGDGATGNKGVGGVTLSSLVLPERLTVVDPKNTGSSKPSLLKSLLTALTPTALPGSDYSTDRVSVYVNERSLETFGSVSEILCMVRQSKYDAMMNQGPYIAQVDKNLCSSARSDASSAGQNSTNQSSGATMPNYESWTVNSFRASSSSPHIVQVWVHSTENNGGPTKLIYAKIVIMEGADTAPPYGIFTMNFKFYDPAADPGLTTILAKGFLNAQRDAGGKVLLFFATEDKDSYEITKATLDKDVVNNSGAGSVLKAETGFWLPEPRIMRFNLAYNTDNFLRTDQTGSICLDRTNIVESSWRYGLYTTDTNTQVPVGTRVVRNSNIQVKKQGTNVYGSIGYWGAWFPSVNGTPVAIADGDTVSKHDYTTNTDTDYTVFQRGGKLKKYTRNTLKLADIKNIPLIAFSSGAPKAVVWDGNANFTTFAVLNSNGSWSTITPQLFDMSALSWVDISFYSQSLGGSLIVKLPQPTTGTGLPNQCANNGNGTYNCNNKATLDRDVILLKEDVVFPGDAVQATQGLACFERCPVESKLSTTNPFDTTVSSYQTVTPTLASYVSYSFDTNPLSPTYMVLNDAVGKPIVTTTPDPSFSNGISSGLLFDPTPANLDLLVCPWDSSITCAGLGWAMLPEFYVWETGPNTWNQFVTVRDIISGSPVRFEPPLQVKYLYSQTTNTKYNGSTFYLQYSGFGDLQGIPGKCVNIDTGSDANCSDSGSNQAIRWVPEFSIPSADALGDITELEDAVNPAIRYFVKPLEKEQRLGPGGNCTGLTAVPYQLPSMSSWVDPIIGPEPVITAPPAVIGGVVQ